MAGVARKQSRTWCFTLNNYTDMDELLLKDLEKNYIVYGREVGENGTPHLQGYIIWKRNYTLKQVKKVHATAHWEVAKAADAMNYCMKDKNYYVEDNRKQGKRTDIHEAMKMALEGKMVEIREKFPAVWAKSRAALRFAPLERNWNPRPIESYEKPYVTWMWGPSGTGKTRKVYDMHDWGDIWSVNIQNGFFIGYMGQPIVLFDDFRKDDVKFNFMLKLLDRYPINVNVKNLPAGEQWRPLRLYVTSPFSPSDMYADTDEEVEQLLRRIDEVREIVLSGVEEDPPNTEEEIEISDIDWNDMSDEEQKESRKKQRRE